MSKFIEFHQHTLQEALVEAVIANNYQETCALLSQGAEPDGFIDRDNLTPLSPCAKNLVLQGEDVSATDLVV